MNKHIVFEEGGFYRASRRYWLKRWLKENWPEAILTTLAILFLSAALILSKIYGPG